MDALKQSIEEILTKDGGWMSFSAIFNRCDDTITSEKIREVVDAMLRRKQLQMIHGPLGLEYALAGVPLPADRREPAPAIAGKPSDVQMRFSVPQPKPSKWKDPGDPQKLQEVKAHKAPVVATPIVVTNAMGRKPQPNGHTRDLILAMLEHETDVTPEKIAKDLNVSKTTAIYHLRKLGLMPGAEPKAYFRNAKDQPIASLEPQHSMHVEDESQTHAPSSQQQLEETLEITAAVKTPAVLPMRKDLPPASFALWSTGELRIEYDEQNWVVLDKDETNGLITYLKRMGALTAVSA